MKTGFGLSLIFFGRRIRCGNGRRYLHAKQLAFDPPMLCGFMEFPAGGREGQSLVDDSQSIGHAAHFAICQRASCLGAGLADPKAISLEGADCTSGRCRRFTLRPQPAYLYFATSAPKGKILLHPEARLRAWAPVNSKC